MNYQCFDSGSGRKALKSLLTTIPGQNLDKAQEVSTPGQVPSASVSQVKLFYGKSVAGSRR